MPSHSSSSLLGKGRQSVLNPFHVVSAQSASPNPRIGVPRESSSSGQIKKPNGDGRRSVSPHNSSMLYMQINESAQRVRYSQVPTIGMTTA
jgi:hypothetical protein